MSRKCSSCNRELEKLKWDLNSGHLRCPYCFNIIMRKEEFTNMGWFERKLNFHDVEIISERMEVE